MPVFTLHLPQEIAFKEKKKKNTRLKRKPQILIKTIFWHKCLDKYSNSLLHINNFIMPYCQGECEYQFWWCAYLKTWLQLYPPPPAPTHTLQNLLTPILAM